MLRLASSYASKRLGWGFPGLLFPAPLFRPAGRQGTSSPPESRFESLKRPAHSQAAAKFILLVCSLASRSPLVASCGDRGGKLGVRLLSRNTMDAVSREDVWCWRRQVGTECGNVKSNRAHAPLPPRPDSPMEAWRREITGSRAGRKRRAAGLPASAQHIPPPSPSSPLPSGTNRLPGHRKHRSKRTTPARSQQPPSHRNVTARRSLQQPPPFVQAGKEKRKRDQIPSLPPWPISDTDNCPWQVQFAHPPWPRREWQKLHTGLHSMAGIAPPWSALVRAVSMG